MKYYTKEWYALMQCQNYTTGMKKLPDRVYTDKEIDELYQKRRKQFIAREKRSYNAPPIHWVPEDYEGAGLFDGTDPESGETIQYIAELLGEENPPKSHEEFFSFLDSQYEQNMRCWEQRLPFDKKESGEVFDCMVRGRMRYMPYNYPAWVAEELDMRLPAIDLMPESVYNRLHKEELQNRAAWRKIERQAEKTLSEHRKILSREIVEGFHFHDAEVLKLKKRGSDYEMLLNVEGAGGDKPYMKVTFVDICAVERESGLRLCVKHCENGEFSSNCSYLYDELYAVPDGVEIHMLLSTCSLKYLTVRCRDVRFETIRETPDL